MSDSWPVHVGLVLGPYSVTSVLRSTLAALSAFETSLTGVTVFVARTVPWLRVHVHWPDAFTVEKTTTGLAGGFKLGIVGILFPLIKGGLATRVDNPRAAHARVSRALDGREAPTSDDRGPLRADARWRKSASAAQPVRL